MSPSLPPAALVLVGDDQLVEMNACPRTPGVVWYHQVPVASELCEQCHIW